MVPVTPLVPETSLWANRKCLFMCAVVAMANMQYGLDSAVLAGLQAMPGFLAVFGHPNPKLAGGYGIDVKPFSPRPGTGRRSNNTVTRRGLSNNSLAPS